MRFFSAAPGGGKPKGLSEYARGNGKSCAAPQQSDQAVAFVRAARCDGLNERSWGERSDSPIGMSSLIID
jgi:hypothetical protein